MNQEQFQVVNNLLTNNALGKLLSYTAKGDVKISVVVALFISMYGAIAAVSKDNSL